MNIINKVTLQSLKKNRARTLVTIIGVILSSAMICAVTTFAVSFRQFLLDDAIYSDGDYYGEGIGVSLELLEKIKSDERVSGISISQDIGYSALEEGENPDKPYLFIMGADKAFISSMPVHLTGGRLPENAHEIILPVHVKENGGASYKIGDTVTFDIGERKSGDITLTQLTPFISDYKNEETEEIIEDSEPDIPEELVKKETRAYTVVGFYERPSFENYSAAGYSSITVIDDNLTDEYTYDIYIKTEKPKDIYNLMKDYNLTGGTNWAVLAYSGASRYSGFYSVLFGFSAIVIGIIVVGSVSLIYNAFSISVSERTKQFGLLSSIGATKKQLRKSVRFEAGFVGLIGIPIGIICGIGGIGTTLFLIRNKIDSIFNGRGASLSLHVSWISIIAAILISFATVMISSWIPSKRAVKINAIDAIRQSKDINIRPNDVKTSKLVSKLFGFEGMLAHKYYKRNRRKYRTTVISLFISIVLFISTSAFCMYLTEASGGFSSYGYDICYIYSSGDNESLPESEIYRELSDTKYVTDSSLVKSVTINSEICRENLSEKFLNYLETSGSDLTEKIMVNIPCVFIEDEKYKTFLYENGLDQEKFMGGANALVYDNSTVFENQNGKFYTFNMLEHGIDQITFLRIKDIEGYNFMYQDTDKNGDKVYIYENKKNGESLKFNSSECIAEETLKIGDFTDVLPFSVSNDFVFMYPMSALNNFDLESANVFTKMCFKTSDHNSTYAEMENVLKDHGIGNENLTDYAKQEENSRNIVMVINIFAYGFIVLISLISVANVFNTISTNISLRRREFAMLKSVGITQRGLKKMMNFECLLYGVRSLIAGLPVSFILTYFIYVTTDAGYATDFKLPWLAVIIAVISVFSVVFVTMIYSMSKINRENPIDALKNENF